MEKLQGGTPLVACDHMLLDITGICVTSNACFRMMTCWDPM